MATLDTGHEWCFDDQVSMLRANLFATRDSESVAEENADFRLTPPCICLAPVPSDQFLWPLKLFRSPSFVTLIPPVCCDIYIKSAIPEQPHRPI